MEEIIYDVQENTKDEQKNEKKQFTILGFTLTKIFAYIIIYSVIGFVIETIFALITKGVLESRKSFLYGPFCAIYGIGATVMILGLQRFKKNNYTLFAGGVIIGSLTEYAVSLFGELIYHIKWWDYSNMPFNINGRICVLFSAFWGILAIYLMTHVHPNIDKLLDKINPKVLKNVTITATILIFIDFIVSSFAVKMFYVRLIKYHNIDIEGVNSSYTALYEKPYVKDFVDKVFSDEIMLKSFPNIKVTSKDGKITMVCDILKDIQPYYLRVFTKKPIKIDK